MVAFVLITAVACRSGTTLMKTEVFQKAGPCGYPESAASLASGVWLGWGGLKDSLAYFLVRFCPSDCQGTLGFF